MPGSGVGLMTGPPDMLTSGLLKTPLTPHPKCNSMAQDKYPAAASEIISPFTMPPSQYNALPEDISSQLARTQLRRRLSTQSSNASSSSKRNSARVTKLRSADNSPHKVQRRRTTTAAPTARGHPRPPHNDPYLTREQRLWHYYQSRKALLEARPFSWHPGSVPVRMTDMPLPINEPAMGSAITGLENLAVSDPSASLQQSIQDAFSLGYGYPTSMPSHPFEQRITASGGLYPVPGSEGRNTYPPYSSHDFFEPNLQDSCINQATAYPPSDCLSNPWPHPGLSGSSSHQVFYDPASIPPVMSGTNNSLYLQSKEIPDFPPEPEDEEEETEEEGDELVGIGLYDNEDGGYVSTLNSAISSDPVGRSLGKDLKLEETWQPCQQEEDEGGDSSDEPDETEEDMPLSEAHPGGGGQTALYSTYGDLSDQSFFFHDALDTGGDEDQYTNYLALDSGFPAGQVKPQATGSGNFLWI
ncbi:MAG: hypothetical protein Q9163_004413 [Psora crenata]